MKYQFKALPELGWAVAIAIAMVILPALVTLEPEKVVDWRVWLVALGGASIRATAGAAIDYLRRSMAQPDEVQPSTAEPDPPTYPVLHRACGKVAFVSIVPPIAGADLQATECRHVDGRPMVDGDPIRCDACRAELTGVLAQGGQWVTVSATATFGSA